MSAVLDYLAAGLVGGTVLALITFAITRLLERRVPAALLAALWAIVLLKFVVPFGPSSSLSLSSLLSPGGADAALPQIGKVEALAQLPAAAGATSPWLIALAVLYFAGLAIVIVRGVRNYARRRLAVAQMPTATGSLATLADNAASCVGLRRAPTIKLAPCGQPLLVGVAKPTVVLPRTMLSQPAAARAALLHELSHVRRKDHWLRALQAVATAIYYFYPVVHWVNRRLSRQREIACDARAIEAGRLCPTTYGRILIGLARSGSAHALAMAPPMSQLEARVRALIDRRRSRIGPVLVVALAAWFAFATAGAANGSSAAIPDLDNACNPAPEIGALILTHHPEADADGDGELSKAEICAHQARMKQLVLDEIAETTAMSHLRESMEVDLSDPREPRLSVLGDTVSLSNFTNDLEISSAFAGSRICATARCQDDRPTAYDTRVLVDTNN